MHTTQEKEPVPPEVLLRAACVILCVFKSLLLCHGPSLAWTVLMMSCRRSPRFRCLQPFVLVVGSLACPLACPDLSVLFLGTGPIWDLFKESGYRFAGLGRRASDSNQKKND